MSVGVKRGQVDLKSDGRKLSLRKYKFLGINAKLVKDGWEEKDLYRQYLLVDNIL